MHGAREPSDDTKASTHAHFYEQIRQVLRLQSDMQWHELSADSPGTGMRTSQWLLLQVESLMMRDREQRAISERESTLTCRNRQARLTGGNSEGGGDARRASAMAATIQRLGMPTDQLASGRAKGETTCNLVNQEKMCPEGGQGCPYKHKKPKAPAALGQPGASGDGRAAGGKSDRRGRNDGSASRGSRGEDRPRSSTPSNNFSDSNATTSRTRAPSGPSKERQGKMA
eukprot:9306788-Pyramimonas_sp.AAC.1